MRTQCKCVGESLIESIIANEELSTVFQPIVSLRTGVIIGYEALTRGPVGSGYERPDVLFAAAEDGMLTWELEYLCRRLAINRYAAMGSDALLFLNVNPGIIEDPRFKKGFTREHIVNGGLAPANVVFEITERTSISNYLEFCGILKHYTDQGFRIAIDDTGAGYSGLNMMARIRPQFVKIDMNLVRDIDKDPFKQNLIRFLTEFAVSTNLKIIAEGIETEEELKTLIGLNVELGQGFFLGRPVGELSRIPNEIMDKLLSAAESHVSRDIKTIATANVGDFASPYQWLKPDTPCSAVEEIFETNQDIMGIPIVSDGTVCGLIMRDRFYANLASKYGYSLYHGRPISKLMDPDPLCMDHRTPIEQANRLAMGRRNSILYDYIIVTLGNSYYGIITVKDLLERTTELEMRYAKYSQPLTGLPGNVVIEGEVTAAIQEPEFSVLYVDLDNFKAYNDVYGFERGDDLIRFTADLLRKIFGGQDFVGHIGGDDFVVVCRRWAVGDDALAFIRLFDEDVRGFYTEEDQKNGFIRAVNRRGEGEVYPIVSISVAIIQNTIEQFQSYRHVAARAAEVKCQCKAISQSCCCYDRRTVKDHLTQP